MGVEPTEDESITFRTVLKTDRVKSVYAQSKLLTRSSLS